MYAGHGYSQSFVSGFGREEALRFSHLITAVLAVALTSAGFIFGWAMADDLGWDRTSKRQSSSEETTASRQPPARDLSLPSEDVDGAEIEGLPRYPGSVRIEYIREDQGRITWTETEYLTGASLEQTREFYRDAFRTGGWSVNDVGFTQSSWVFFVVDGEKEVFVNLRPRGEIVEIDIEQTEPEANETQTNDAAPSPSQGARQPAPVYNGDDD